MTSVDSRTQLVLGTAQLTQRYGITATRANHVEHVSEVLATAEECGIATLDTAPGYGASERVIGAYGWRGRVHTKIERAIEPAQSLESSLFALRRQSVDVLYLHDSTEVTRPDSAVLRAAARLVGSGTRAIGASIYDVDEFDAAVTSSLVSVVQLPMNPIDRRFAGEPIRRARDAGVQVFTRSVMLQGVLLAKPSELPSTVQPLARFVSAFQSIAEHHELSPAALALGWIRAQAGLAGVIVGAQGARELRELAAAWVCDVPLEAISAVDHLDTPPEHFADPRRWTRLP